MTTKLIHADKKIEKIFHKLGDVVFSSGIYYMIVLDDERNYRFLNLHTFEMDESRYVTLQQMDEHNDEDIILDAEIHIK